MSRWRLCYGTPCGDDDLVNGACQQGVLEGVRVAVEGTRRVQWKSGRRAGQVQGRWAGKERWRVSAQSRGT